jgi:hypothetical protein
MQKFTKKLYSCVFVIDAATENGTTGLVTVDDLAGSFASLIAETARYDS